MAASTEDASVGSKRKAGDENSVAVKKAKTSHQSNLKEEKIKNNLDFLSVDVKKVQTALTNEPKKSFPTLQNDNLLRAFRGEPTDRTPIWVHRQAGRYMTEYKAVRQQAGSFFKLCQTPALACEVTLQPITEFDLDAAIIFSDILVVLQAINLEVQMVPGKGPVVPEPITIKDEKCSRFDLNVDVYAKLNYVFEAITLTRHALQGKVPLIGFTGAPFTLFCYAVEGSSSKTWAKAIRMMYVHSDFSHKIFDLLTETNINYLVAQVKAGAQALEVFDSWVGILAPNLFDEYIFPCLKKICTKVKERCQNELGIDIPITLFAKGANEHLSELATLGYDTLSIDWTIEPSDARKRVGERICLQGNLDPCALYASEQKLRKIVKNMMNSFGPNRHVANLGHGMFPTHDREKLKIFIDAVHSHDFKAPNPTEVDI